jgi:putative oxidoreductase
MNAAGLLVLRLVVAVVLVAHGSHQIFGVFAGPAVGPGGLTTTAARFSTLGLEPGYSLAVIAGTIQLAAGALITVGLLTRWAALATALYLGIVIWKDQWRWGFFANWMLNPERGHGIEMSVVLVGALVCLALAGPGDWSADGRRAQAAAARASGRARLRKH